MTGFQPQRIKYHSKYQFTGCAVEMFGSITKPNAKYGAYLSIEIDN